VITGSYNFTWSAQARNAENLLILRDNPALLQRYLNNWQRHHAEAQPFKPKPKKTRKPLMVVELSVVWNDLIADLNHPDILWQLAALAISLLLAKLVEGFVREQVAAHAVPDLGRARQLGRGSLKRVIFPIAALGFDSVFTLAVAADDAHAFTNAGSASAGLARRYSTGVLYSAAQLYACDMAYQL
jgi:phosphatidylserine/phosphatidylglycerophosphate/cardiolipin synthase-like enzyme